MFTFDSKHTRIVYKIRAQEQVETFVVVNRRQFGGNYIPMISFHSQAPHVQGHFEIWKQVFTLSHKVIAPAGFWPRGQNPRRHYRNPRVIENMYGIDRMR